MLRPRIGRLCRFASMALGLALPGCESRPTATTAPARPAPPTPAPATSVAPSQPAPGEPLPSAAPPVATATPPNRAISEATARRVLFGTSVPVEASRCAGATREKISCWLGVRYASDPQAKELVQELYTSFGTVVGQGEARTMDGAYRGTIRLVPTLPTGQDRKHLVWLHAALMKIDAFQKALSRELAPAADRAGLAYQASPLVVEFVRSLDGKRTPSGYASDWTYSYNVQGSLNVSAESVLSLAFHEIFHLNDLDAGSGDGSGGARAWSARALSADVHAILARCKVTTAQAAPRSTACLAPYAPTALQVRGGTYYAFQPGNDIVLEYAAELATRVFDEQRALLGLGPRVAGRPFKCGPPENARTWKAMIDRFFGGMDRVPACRS
ncbi:MAG: hypothetical protein IPF92_11370 [Myxococcales bacterium]|nr:hypothetical protein [Myxococcales bacterium]MBL0198320.1 hypothetical protein [Myxococcales bacterium]